MRNATPIADRLAARTRVDANGCWIWLGQRDRDGYGVIKVAGQPRATHRISYTEHVGPIPQGKQIDHLCRVRACCNPAHLEPVTSKTNTMRSPVAPAAVNSRKTECSSGHPLSGPNLYVGPTGGRKCRACHRLRAAEYRARQPA